VGAVRNIRPQGESKGFNNPTTGDENDPRQVQKSEAVDGALAQRGTKYGGRQEGPAGKAGEERVRVDGGGWETKWKHGGGRWGVGRVWGGEGGSNGVGNKAGTSGGANAGEDKVLEGKKIQGGGAGEVRVWGQEGGMRGVESIRCVSEG